jgi:hypothetical protein
VIGMRGTAGGGSREWQVWRLPCRVGAASLGPSGYAGCVKGPQWLEWAAGGVGMRRF